ncbi:MAG TPA: glycoside hydrolase family 15 protein, partial [Calditerricola sp.]
WIICTLWVALWKIVSASSAGALAEAREWLMWTVRRSLPSGVLPEQVHPYTGQPISVAPLTWSHATFVHVVRQYARRYRELHTEQGGT